MQLVRGYGPKSKLMIIGEAPASMEFMTGIPMTGPSGKEIEYHCEQAGFNINEAYRDNIFQFRLPDDDIVQKTALINLHLKESTERITKTIHEIDPNCILTLGAISFQALTNQEGIMSYRGSLLKSITGHKLIPTIHPSAYLKYRADSAVDYSYKFIVSLDFKKAYEESRTKEFNPPSRYLQIAKNSLDVYSFLREGEKYKKDGIILVSLDIESISCFPVCIALAFSPWHAISIPLLDMTGWNAGFNIPYHELIEIWTLLSKFLNRPDVKYIGQNLKYDLEKLDAPLKLINSLERNKVHADTMLMMGVAYPVFPKALEFSTSVFTREAYYKNEGKEFNPKKDKYERLFLYNAKDAAVTFEVYLALYKELEEFGLLDFYFRFQNRLHDLYTILEFNGVNVDKARRKELHESYMAKFKRNDKRLEEIIGRPVNVNSPKQVSEVLYKDLKLPIRKDTGEDTIVSLLGNHAKDSKQKEALNLILDTRKIRKTISTYLEAELDYDGKMRTSVRICGTDTGRSSNSILKPPVRPESIGLAFQTMTAHGEFGGDLRSIFIPEPGRIFISADESAAQARIVAHLANDTETMDLINNKEIHAITAQWFFGGKIEDHSKRADGTEPPSRFVGKTIRYAGLFGAQKRKIMQTVNTDAKKFNIDYSISEWKAGQLLDIYHARTPKIKGVYYELIKEIAREKNRVLVGPFGRRTQYFDRFDDELLRSMYACIPQGTDHDVLCSAILRVLDFIDWDPALQVHIEAHDGALFSAPESSWETYAKIIKEEMERPIDFSNCSIKRGPLVIPCEIKVGMNYLEMKKVSL